MNPKNKTVTSLYVSLDLLEAVKAHCQAAKTSVSDFFCMAAGIYLGDTSFNTPVTKPPTRFIIDINRKTVEILQDSE